MKEYFQILVKKQHWTLIPEKGNTQKKSHNCPEFLPQGKSPDYNAGRWSTAEHRNTAEPRYQSLKLPKKLKFMALDIVDKQAAQKKSSPIDIRIIYHLDIWIGYKLLL